MIVTEIYLVTRNARDKVQVVLAELEQVGSNFIIMRTTGQYKGKMTEQPNISIEKGKAKRSALQQAELEFNSIINKYLDKGYKRLSSFTTKKFGDITPSEMELLVPSVKSDQNGEIKPMLAKDFNKCKNSVLDKPMLVSRKLNGVRCMMRLNGDNVITISRGGKNYDVSTQKIRPEVLDFLKEHPTYILDGELYCHGKHLQELSGIARNETWKDKCDILEYWIYDIALDTVEFKDRLIILQEMQEVFKDSKKVKVIDHYLTKSWADIQKLHDQWVSEGYEGAVARKPDKVYEPGKRSSTMIKIKAYTDAEFLIIDYKDGLRDEDFCFICETSDGKPFSAKPIGSREIKADYIENIDSIIGKMGTVKYFEMSKDGIPMQPIFQAVRYDLD